MDELFGNRSVWILTKDGDPACKKLYDEHYSKYHYADGRDPKLFIGPGEKLVLKTMCGNAMFAWRKFIDDSGQTGVNNAIFINHKDKSGFESSFLILQAEKYAAHRWPGERLYTYVDPEKLSTSVLGWCYIRARWKRCGETKSGKLIFQKCKK
jgi:hypothetical protein